jgi:hypothetical protein
VRKGRTAVIALGLLGTFVLVLGLVPATRARVDRVLVLTLVVYAGFLARKEVGVGARPQPVPPEGGYLDPTPADEQDVRLARLDQSLAQAAGSGEQFWRVTRPALQRLVAERLRLSKGIDVTADPAGARRQMGEELWQMFSTPAGHAGPAPGRERLRAMVDQLERL